MTGVKAPPRHTAPGTSADIDELRAFLIAHPEIEAFDLLLADSNGVLRGKSVRRHEAESIYENGRFLPSSILGLDVSGQDVDETGLVWSNGDADQCAWPLPASLVPAPWTDPPKGQFRVSVHQSDSAPIMADPRHVLLRQVDALAAQGFRALLAFELEFYLVEASSDDTAGPVPAALPLTGGRPNHIHAYSIEELDRLEPFTRDLYRAAVAQNLPVETLISEYAPGQFELTLHYREAVQAAEDLIALKHLLRGIARRHGMRACFMAKPFADKTGSGMHVHANFCDLEGRNLFADRDGTLSPMLLCAIGGLLDKMAESMIVMAPHRNSWSRFAAQSYAPTSRNWGVNNRGVAVRVPAGSPASRRLEQRMAGVDANPFLVATVTLAAMAHGIAMQSDPGQPAEGDGSAGDTTGMPRGWVEAIELAEGSDFLKSALGETMHRVLLAVKRAEAARFATYVSPLEYQLYLDTV